MDECWLKIFKLRAFGHQCLFVVPLPVENFAGVPTPVKGHLDISEFISLLTFILYNDSKVVSIFRILLMKGFNF